MDEDAETRCTQFNGLLVLYAIGNSPARWMDLNYSTCVNYHFHDTFSDELILIKSGLLLKKMVSDGEVLVSVSHTTVGGNVRLLSS